MSDIVVVDDETKICKLLSDQLVDAGHNTRGFTNPVEAVQQMENAPPDILITDLRMEGMDGIALLKKTKSISPATDVVVMTVKPHVLLQYPAEHLRFDGQYDDFGTAGSFDIVGCGAHTVAVKKLLPPFRARAAGDDPVRRYQTLA